MFQAVLDYPIYCLSLIPVQIKTSGIPSCFTSSKNTSIASSTSGYWPTHNESHAIKSMPVELFFKMHTIAFVFFLSIHPISSKIALKYFSLVWVVSLAWDYNQQVPILATEHFEFHYTVVSFAFFAVTPLSIKYKIQIGIKLIETKAFSFSLLIMSSYLDMPIPLVRLKDSVTSNPTFR